MRPKWSATVNLGFLALLMVVLGAGTATGLSKERWTDEKPYGIFFNSYDPNFYTGFVPRVHACRSNESKSDDGPSEYALRPSYLQS